MPVNNPNQEYRTREEYKRAKAEELQRKKDADKRAKDEDQRTREQEKRAKDEERRKKDADKRARVEEQKRTREDDKRTKDEERKRTHEDDRRAKDEHQRNQEVAPKSEKKVNRPIQQEITEEPRQNPQVKASETTQSREAHRSKETKDSPEKTEAPPKYQRVRIRLIPIWLRLVLLVVFAFISVTLGAIVGYGMIGGGNVSDVFQQSTWTHIVDLVDKGK